MLPTSFGSSKPCEDELCGSPLRVRTQVRLDLLEHDPLKTRLVSDPASNADELDEQRASSLVASAVDSKIASALLQQAIELILRYCQCINACQFFLHALISGFYAQVHVHTRSCQPIVVLVV